MLWLDELERMADRDQWPQARREFDAWLASEPEAEPVDDDEKSVLLKALGLA